MAGRDEEFFKDSEEKLLFLAGLFLRVKGNTGITEEVVSKYYTERFKLLDLPMNDLLNNLVKTSLLLQRDDKFYLTSEGENRAFDIVTRNADYTYSKLLIAFDNSITFKLIAEKLFGRYLGQFNMTDNEQLEKLFSIINIKESDTLLDFGCGLGYITEYLQKQTGAYCTGLDIATEALEVARKRNFGNSKLQFVHQDMNNPDFPSSSLNTIIAIDTMYFVRDLNKTIETFLQLLKPEGSICIFYTQSRFSNEPDSFFTPEGTKLGQILEKLKLKYDYYEFTDNERKHWQLRKQLLEENKENLLKENNEELFNATNNETQYILNNIENNPFKRYLYHIKTSI